MKQKRESRITVDLPSEMTDRENVVDSIKGQPMWEAGRSWASINSSGFVEFEGPDNSYGTCGAEEAKSLAVVLLAAARLALDCQPKAPARECPGYQWVGQSLRYCDGCGQPYWEHDSLQQLNRDRAISPFSDDCWEYVPISAESKRLARAKWEGR